jgi:hypothetical protein
MSNYTLPNELRKMAANFHFLLFLHTNHFVEFTNAELRELAQIVAQGDDEAAEKWAQQNPNWGTLNLIIK